MKYFVLSFLVFSSLFLVACKEDVEEYLDTPIPPTDSPFYPNGQPDDN